MKLLILKILYVLFSNKGTCEFFYTNDLCVLVDVFLRELADLDEDSESVCFCSYFLNLPLSNLGSATTHILAGPPSFAHENPAQGCSLQTAPNSCCSGGDGRPFQNPGGEPDDEAPR